jgi:hypothetical protein
MNLFSSRTVSAYSDIKECNLLILHKKHPSLFFKELGHKE